MTSREEQFNKYAKFNFSELVKIKFKSQPRNATDYYYHPKTKIIYSYYFGDDPGSWEANVKINRDNIKSPDIISNKVEKTESKNSLFMNKNLQKIDDKNPEQVYNDKIQCVADEIKILELKFKLSDNYKLELEILKLEAERKLIEAKKKS